MKYNVDVVRIRENEIELNGWAIGKTPGADIRYEVLDGQGKPMDFRFVRTRRDDVSEIYFGETVKEELGFDIRFPYERGRDYYLVIRGDGKRIKIRYNEELIRKRSSASHRRMRRILDLVNMETVRVCVDYWKENGLRALIRKSRHKLQGIDSEYDYPEWYSLTRPTTEELEAQRGRIFENGPLFSIVIPVYKTPRHYLREMLDSIAAQTYGNFEVCIADGSPAGESTEDVLAAYAEKDPRFRYRVLGENLGIAGNTNAALEMAKGDYVIFADHDDTLTPDALYAFADYLEKNPACDMCYSDEDKLDMDGGALFDPHFKPDFNPDLLCSVNYICHLLCISRGLLDKTGGFRAEYDGAQDYDFIFRASEKAAEIGHVPRVLYHWRCHKDSTASNPESKMYAFEAGARAIAAHYDRMGIAYERVEKGVDYGIYHTIWKITGDPLVSVIIPNKDHTADLDICIRGLMERSTWRNFEIIVIENNSTEPETFAYYGKIRREFPNVRVVTWEREFNYSAINNFGVTFAKGSCLLFLNNDTELIEPSFMEEMLGFLQRPEVGAVGAQLLYEDNTIQHAGVVVGFGGIAGHTFIGLHKSENSYFHRAMSAQDYSAVTAACMMTKKELFEKVGGFTEELAIAFNDIDYCMKVRAEDKLVVYAPYALLHHYESKSRGLEDTPEKVARFNREIAIFARRWPKILAEGDPYYNPNLTLRKSDFSLRDLKKEKIGEPYHLEV